MARRPIRRLGDGIHLRLSPAEADLLEVLPELLASLGDPAADPAAARLDPAAHPGDPEAEAEYRSLVDGEMEEARRRDRQVFSDTLTAAPRGLVMDEEQAAAWLRVVGEARLVVAARLGVDEEGWEQAPDQELAFLHYLSWLQECLVEALEAALDGP